MYHYSLPVVPLLLPLCPSGHQQEGPYMSLILLNISSGEGVCLVYVAYWVFCETP